MRVRPEQHGGDHSAAASEQRTGKQRVAAVVTGADEQRDLRAVGAVEQVRAGGRKAGGSSLHQHASWQRRHERRLGRANGRDVVRLPHGSYSTVTDLARLRGPVDVVAARRRELAGEYLQRNHRHQRLQQRRHCWHPNQFVGIRHDGVVALFGDDDRARAASPHLLNVRQQFACSTDRPSGDGTIGTTTGTPVFDQRDRSVLQLAGRKSFRMHVGELLQLQRTFKRNRVADVAAKKQHGLDVGQRPRNLAHRLHRRRAPARHCSALMQARGRWR